MIGVTIFVLGVIASLLWIRYEINNSPLLDENEMPVNEDGSPKK